MRSGYHRAFSLENHIAKLKKSKTTIGVMNLAKYVAYLCTCQLSMIYLLNLDLSS